MVVVGFCLGVVWLDRRSMFWGSQDEVLLEDIGHGAVEIRWTCLGNIWEDDRW